MSCSDDIRTIESTFVGVDPVSSIGCVVGIARLGAVAVTVRIRSQVEAISFHIVYDSGQAYENDTYFLNFISGHTSKITTKYT
jgi:hypothetical protein